MCNAGPAVARKVAVAVVLPKSRGSLARARLALAETGPTLAAGASVQYVLTVSADRATAGSLTLDPALGNNATRRTITVTA